MVLVKEDNGDWRAYFCTHTEASVAEILEAVADRSALEQVFHDVKEVHGVGQGADAELLVARGGVPSESGGGTR